MSKHPHIERFLTSAAEYLDLESSADGNREQARRFLVDEFCDALAEGPCAHVSTPITAGAETAPVWQVVCAMFYSGPRMAESLCAELAGESPDVGVLLAQRYAQEWLEYLDAAQALVRQADALVDKIAAFKERP